VPIPTRAENQFRVRAEDVAARITPRTKAILLSYPSNPTGATMTREGLQAIVNLAVEHDLYLLTDEIYERLSYDAPHVSVAALPAPTSAPFCSTVSRKPTR
jgi:aspartate/methionine/tyrosine aminotransferase